MRGYRDNHIKEDTMRNKRLLAISAIAISASVFMTACSFGGDGKTDKTETVEVTDTPTPEVTQAPTETPVPTIAPNVQSTTYTSADKSIAINLPDATWANKTYRTAPIHQAMGLSPLSFQMLPGPIRRMRQICSASNHQSREIS